jgi:LuxR family maltose regulon positive regulatory protein
MAGPLLQTKLYVPKRRRGLVARPRLSQRLSHGIESRLTVVSAPVGSGKTTLLAEWMTAPSAGDRPAAWLSLDENDNEAARFWTYVITALQAAVPGIGAGALSLRESAQPPPMETVLVTLLNELGAAGGTWCWCSTTTRTSTSATSRAAWFSCLTISRRSSTW